MVQLVGAAASRGLEMARTALRRPQAPHVREKVEMASTENAMNHGAQQYRDVLDTLQASGLPAAFTQTGGMNAALEVRLEGGRTLLITDCEDSLSWDRADHQGWGVGLYPAESEYDDGPLAFGEDPDGSPETLLSLIQRVLIERPTP